VTIAMTQLGVQSLVDKGRKSTSKPQGEEKQRDRQDESHKREKVKKKGMGKGLEWSEGGGLILKNVNSMPLTGDGGIKRSQEGWGGEEHYHLGGKKGGDTFMAT